MGIFSCWAFPYLLLLFLLLRCPSGCYGFGLANRSHFAFLHGVRTPQLWPPAGAGSPCSLASAGGAPATQAGDVEIWSISDLPAAEGALLRAAIAAADKHRVADVVCILRCSSWNLTEERREQDRLLLHIKREPLLSPHARPVPEDRCLQSASLGAPKGQLQRPPPKSKEDLLNYEWEMMAIATGLSATHLDSVAEAIIQELTRSYGPSVYLGRDGRGTSGWVALNLGKLHIHLMTPITRKRYTLEILHKGAPRVDLRGIIRPNDDPLAGFGE